MSVLRIGLTVGALFGFPALAVLAWRSGGSKRLVAATLASFGVVMLYALFAASPQLGNSAAESIGYSGAAPAVLILFGITFGPALVAAALAVGMLGRDRLPFWATYAATVGAAACGWVLGMVVAMGVL